MIRIHILLIVQNIVVIIIIVIVVVVDSPFARHVVGSVGSWYIKVVRVR
jgi:hypothetical protein